MRLLTSLLIVLSFLSCNISSSQSGNDKFLISSLEKAENKKDLDAIKKLFDDDATLYTTDLMPVSTKRAVVSVFEFVFSMNDREYVEYKVDSTRNTGTLVYEYGKLTTKKISQPELVEPFMAVFKNQNKSYSLIEISYGKEDKLLKKLPTLLIPTGDYNIGLTSFFFDREQSGNGRQLSFQIWYPSNAKSQHKEPFRNDNVVACASAFLGFPPFATSYFSRVESHSIPNAPAIPGIQFPVLVYNHGYGGYSQVYQTVFEDLASHGYIVVSIGHEHESALLIKEDGELICNLPDNPFYRKRAPELNGSEIGRWQSDILNSDNPSENQNAYKEMLLLTPLHNESTRLWASDTRAVMEKLVEINNTDHSLKGIFDFQKTGIFGHSLGGATAGQLCFGDSSFKAGINLDGFQFGDLYYNKLSTPFLFASSNETADRFLRANTFIEKAEQDCYQLTIKGFSHDDFTDLKYITEGDKKAMELQRALIKSFFDKYLKNIKLDIKDLEKEFEQITIHASQFANQ